MRTWETQHQMQRAATGYNKDTAEREGSRGRREAEVHGRQDTVGQDWHTE